MMTKSSSLAIIFLLTSSAIYGQIKKENLDTTINRLGERYLKDKQGIGVSIGVYNNGTTYYYNYGATEKSQVKLPTQNTVYEIGSITKAFVSLILANAVIEKKVNLGDDIRKYLDGTYPNL